MRIDFKRYYRAAINLGVDGLARRTAFRIFASSRRASPASPDGRLRALTSRHARYPVFARPGTSDVAVFDQIFSGREYRCLDDVKDAELIIDCGANVGYSAAYFLTRHPRARVVSLEPDPANAAVLRRTLAPYGDRATIIEKGVWSHSARLVFDERFNVAGKEWGRRVRPARDGEAAAVEVVSIGDVLEAVAADRVSILKIDIEGAEAAVFASGADAWLGRVDNLVIELHGKACREIFFKAINGFGFEVSTCDELTVCKRRPCR